jgi:Xaa-Pro aminopeptidase
MYPHQNERLTGALERAGLEAVVATSSANLAYVAGSAGLVDAGVTGRGLAVFTRRGTALVLPAIAVPSAVVDGDEVDHIVCFGDFPAEIGGQPNVALRRLQSILDQRAADFPEALGLALDRLGVRRGPVGVDASGLAPPEWERVNERLLAFKIVNGTDHLAAARRVKAPFEIECLQRALGIAEEALNEVIQTLARGSTEREAAAAYRAEVVKRGAEPRRVLISMGERTGLPMAWPTDRALRPGELVRFDVGCVHRGYHAGVARTAVLGEPTREHDASYGGLLAGLEAALDGVVPGRSAGSVARAAVEAVRAHGLARFQPGPVGHGVGLDPCEPPALAQGDGTALEAGEVLQITLPRYEIGTLGFGVTETVLVATTGARPLNRSARGLVALD